MFNFLALFERIRKTELPVARFWLEGLDLTNSQESLVRIPDTRNCFNSGMRPWSGSGESFWVSSRKTKTFERNLKYKTVVEPNHLIACLKKLARFARIKKYKGNLKRPSLVKGFLLKFIKYVGLHVSCLHHWYQFNDEKRWLVIFVIRNCNHAMVPKRLYSSCHMSKQYYKVSMWTFA